MELAKSKARGIRDEVISFYLDEFGTDDPIFQVIGHNYRMLNMDGSTSFIAKSKKGESWITKEHSDTV